MIRRANLNQPGCRLDRRLPVLVASLAVSGCQAAGLALLVPAYFDPAPGGDWDVLARAASRVPLIAILNPMNGPGAAVDGDYLRAVRAVRAAGGKVIGYVYTSYGGRPFADVNLDLDRYAQFYPIDGYFLDEMSNEAWQPRFAYYAGIRSAVAAKDPDYQVIGNPGTNTEEAYLKLPAADTLVIFENDAGYESFTPAAWVSRYRACQFGHLTYQVSLPATMTRYLDLAVSRNAGFMYATDDAGANPWDRLPSYWEAEVSYVESLNQQAARSNPPGLSVITGTGGARTLRVEGVPGRYVVEMSTNLQTWTPVHTNLPPRGTFAFPLPEASGPAARFYRSRQ